VKLQTKLRTVAVGVLLMLTGCWADIEASQSADSTPVTGGGQTDPAADAPRDPGTVTLHRLNRTEYNNTIRDLLDTELRPADDFPADDTGYGFDNIADVLTVSPLHLELYERAAQQLVERIFPTELRLLHFEAEDATATAGGSYRDMGWNIWSNGAVSEIVEVEVAGTYLFRARVMGQQAGPDPVHMTFTANGVVFGDFEIEGSDLQVVEASVELEVDAYELAINFTNDFYEPDAGLDRNLVVDSFQLEGPLGAGDSAERRAVMVCDPETDGPHSCARTVLETFAGRAWRRPVGGAELDGLVALYGLGVDDGALFEEALGFALQAVLVSPTSSSESSSTPSRDRPTPTP